MKAIVVLAALLGAANAHWLSGGCPLNYGDSCGWTESTNGEICYKPVYHGKSFMDASELCWTLGTYECNSELLDVSDIGDVMEEADLKYLPKLARVDAMAYGFDQKWQDIDHEDVTFPSGMTASSGAPDALPTMYEDHHIISAVWDTRANVITGNTPVEDRVSYICTSCVSAETMCPLICEFCIPHMPMDGYWSGWETWSECAGTCEFGDQTRTRYCNPPAWGGEDCNGVMTETRQCYTGLTSECVVDGAWGEWRATRECGPTLSAADEGCGDGESERKRYCDSPPPSATGGGCALDAVEIDYPTCDFGRTECAFENGDWCDWQDWSDCSATCDVGERRRERDCMCPPADIDGGFNECPWGAQAEAEWCRIEKCGNFLGTWSSWGANTCKDQCLVPHQQEHMAYQERTCTDADEGGMCMGTRRKSELCDPDAPTSTCATSFLLMVIGGADNHLYDSFPWYWTTESRTFDWNSPSSFDISTCASDPMVSALPLNMTYGLIAARTEGKVVVCGGQSQDNGTDVCFSLSAITDSNWIQFPRLREPRVDAAIAQLTDDDFMVLGGDYNQREGCTTEFYYASDGDFTPGPEIPGGSIYGACADAIDHDTVILAGGIIDGAPTNRVLKYTISTNTWEYLSNMHVKRAHFQCSVWRETSSGELRFTAVMGMKTVSAETLNLETGEWVLDSEISDYAMWNGYNGVFDPLRKEFVLFGGAAYYGNSDDEFDTYQTTYSVEAAEGSRWDSGTDSNVQIEGFATVLIGNTDFNLDADCPP